MAIIGTLANLESLNVGYTTVGDAGLAHLSGLTKLTELLLDTVELTDAGVASRGRPEEPAAAGSVSHARDR